MSTTLYHSKLREKNWVPVTRKTDVRASKWSKPNDPKPDWCVLLIGGEEFTYTVENRACADVLMSLPVGREYIIRAVGSKEDATIELEAHPDPDPAATARQSRPPQPTLPAAQSAPAASQEPRTGPAAGVTPQPHIFGATCGMAINNAVQSANAMGAAAGTPAWAKLVYEIASDLIRVSQSLEAGHLAPKPSERQQPGTQP